MRDVLRRLVMVPVTALLVLLGGAGMAVGSPSSDTWEEVSGEAYFTNWEVLQPVRALGASGWYRDTVRNLAEGQFVLPDGPVGVVADTQVQRTFNDTFYEFNYGESWLGDWDGFFVGSQVVEFDSVSCTGPIRGEFGSDYQAPATAHLRCSDGSSMVLHYDGTPDQMGAGYDLIIGAIRR